MTGLSVHCIGFMLRCMAGSSLGDQPDLELAASRSPTRSSTAFPFPPLGGPLLLLLSEPRSDLDASVASCRTCWKPSLIGLVSRPGFLADVCFPACQAIYMDRSRFCPSINQLGSFIIGCKESACMPSLRPQTCLTFLLWAPMAHG
jgi:hypothetical protein